MKKILTVLVCLMSAFSFMCVSKAADKKEEVVTTTASEPKKVNVYVFTKENCPYCEAAKTFLNELLDDSEYGKMFQIVEYQVWDASWTTDETNNKIMNSVASYFEEEIGGAPYLVVGKTYSFNGFNESYEDTIKSEIKKAYEDEEYYDLVGAVIQNNGELPKDLQKSDLAVTIVGWSIAVLAIGGLSLLVFFSRREN